MFTFNSTRNETANGKTPIIHCFEEDKAKIQDNKLSTKKEKKDWRDNEQDDEEMEESDEEINEMVNWNCSMHIFKDERELQENRLWVYKTYGEFLGQTCQSNSDYRCEGFERSQIESFLNQAFSIIEGLQNIKFVEGFPEHHRTFLIISVLEFKNLIQTNSKYRYLSKRMISGGFLTILEYQQFESVEQIYCQFFKGSSFCFPIFSLTRHFEALLTHMGLQKYESVNRFMNYHPVPSKPKEYMTRTVKGSSVKK